MIWINIVIFQVYHFHYFIYIGWTNKYLFIHESSRSHIFEANYLVPATYITFSSPSEAGAEVAHTCRRIRIFKLVKSYRKCLCYRFSQIMHQKCKINKIGNFKFLSPSESVSDRPAFVRAAPGGPIASFYASVQCVLHHFMYFLSLPDSTIRDGIFICPLPKIVTSMCDTLKNSTFIFKGLKLLNCAVFAFLNNSQVIPPSTLSLCTRTCQNTPSRVELKLSFTKM